MNIIKVIKFIIKSKDPHFIYVDSRLWKRWSLIIRFFIWRNKNYVPCIIYRKKYKFLKNIVIVGLKWNGKNVKRRTSGFAKEFLKENKDAKCIYCSVKLHESNATADHIIPISDGGNNTQVNIVITCFNCNNERGSLNFYDYMKKKNPKNKTKYF